MKRSWDLEARCCYQHYRCCCSDEDKNVVADAVRAILKYCKRVNKKILPVQDSNCQQRRYIMVYPQPRAPMPVVSTEVAAVSILVEICWCVLACLIVRVCRGCRCTWRRAYIAGGRCC